MRRRSEGVVGMFHVIETTIDAASALLLYYDRELALSMSVNHRLLVGVPDSQTGSTRSTMQRLLQLIPCFPWDIAM